MYRRHNAAFDSVNRSETVTECICQHCYKSGRCQSIRFQSCFVYHGFPGTSMRVRMLKAATEMKFAIYDDTTSIQLHQLKIEAVWEHSAKATLIGRFLMSHCGLDLSLPVFQVEYSVRQISGIHSRSTPKYGNVN